jgi:hypothetical protein
LWKRLDHHHVPEPRQAVVGTRGAGSILACALTPRSAHGDGQGEDQRDFNEEHSRPFRSLNWMVSFLLSTGAPMNCNTGLAWLGFWIFMAVFITCDHYIYSQGHDSFFQTHKTEAEKELQRLRIEELKLKIQILQQKN